ncbi:unnamed protein product, partial [Mesorhabditis spiculigera]
MNQEPIRAVPGIATPSMSVRGPRPLSPPPPIYTPDMAAGQYQGKLSPNGTSYGGSSGAELIAPPKADNRFLNSVYWLVNNHRKFAIRQVLLVIVFTACTLLGGMFFYFSEHGYEKKMVRRQVAALNAEIASLAQQMPAVLATGNATDVYEFIRNAYKELLKNERRYTLSALWKYDDGNYAWQYWPAVFYCTNIFMGVDYGSVPGQNGVGRLTLAIYAFGALALAQVVVRDLGHWYLFLFTKLYAAIYGPIRKLLGLGPKDEIELPVVISFGLLLASWALCAAFICGYDAAFGPGSINYWLSIYLSFLTVTTIGIGDIMPTYTYKAPLWKFFCFFIGTPFRSVNHSAFVHFERTIFYPLTKLGDKIMGAVNNRAAPGAQKPKPSEDELDGGIRNFITDRTDLYGGQYGRVRMTAEEVDDSLRPNLNADLVRVP